MPGIHPYIICHKLAICPKVKPISQKKRKMGEEWHKVVKKEVEKIFHANFIREVGFSTWLANIVIVKKANDKWSMCTNYTDMNKACPKEAYLLPSIDRLVSGASRF